MEVRIAQLRDVVLLKVINSSGSVVSRCMTTQQATARNKNAIKETEKRRTELDGQYPIEWNSLPRTRKEAQELQKTQYFNAKACPYDHLKPRWTATGMCSGCLLRRQKEIDKAKREDRAEQIIAKNEFRNCPECGTKFLLTPDDHQDKIYCGDKCASAESKRNYVITNPERRREQSARSAMKRYFEMPIEERRAIARKNTKNMGPRRRARHSVRTRINLAVRKALNGGERTYRLKDIDFDIEKYMTHMESLWKPGMSWENYGLGPGKWVRDEIKPMCAFDMSDPKQARECMRLENLRPLWWEENLKKGAEDRRLYGMKE